MQATNPDEPDLGEPVSGLRKAARWWAVLRYHRKSQLAGRLVSLARKRWSSLSVGRRDIERPRSTPTLRGNGAFPALLHRKLAARRARGSSDAVSAILDGRFTFLHETRELPDPVDWRLAGFPEVTHLWRFHLHYHEFLLDLAAEGIDRKETIWFERAWDLVRQWIDHNHPTRPDCLADAWHPYCISRRLPTWILLRMTSPAPEAFARDLLASIWSQARFLERHLETDIGGNHLLENARALVFTGAFLAGPDADRWLGLGERIMRKELPEQILPHGEHFERSPMYHAQVLEALLDIRDVSRLISPKLADFCDEACHPMAAFLRKILHPDGRIPLLGDSCFGESAPIRDLIARAAEAGPCDAPTATDPQPSALGPPSSQVVGDYWTYRHGSDFLLFDAGPVAPDHLPAHAHADLLGIEGSIGGQRVLVDSGNFHYQMPAMRRYCRSTAAHNVLEIDDQGQCDMWSSFRMGQRGWPGELTTGAIDGLHWARATHNAYRRLGVPLVGRWVGCRADGSWLMVDWAEGSGRHKLTNRLHLAPDVQATQVSANLIEIECDGLVLRLQPLTPGSLRIASSWYCPEFGRRQPSSVVEWTAEDELPTACGWRMDWGDREDTIALVHGENGDILLRWNGRSMSICGGG
jgi:uncharacterized heparinase superfamily protein